MFDKIVSGLVMSPSLGEEFIAYEKTLAKRYKLQKISIFLVATLVLINILTIPFSSGANTSRNSLVSPQTDSIEGIALTSTTNSSNAVTLEASQEVTFRLSATNEGSEPRSLAPRNNISDILEYARITNTGDGIIQEDEIVWPEVILLPGETYEASFNATILDHIPTLGRSSVDANSYDCRLSNIFGNRIDLGIDCSSIKNVDIFTTSLPNIDVFLTTIILVVMLLILSTSAYRTNILLKQLSFIRKHREDLYATE
ncbi:MAG: hypothetical protein KIG14_00975 [Candidatus Sacchiramonaceae bacterium]|nr:hypothetical protein [Candidatus Saccharimonadaceae bacterium]